jgi:importin subunit beta-1
VKQAERNFILQIVGKCLNNNDLRIQHAAWECVLQIASEYYQFLDKYAGDLGKHSIETIKRYITVSQDCSIPEDQKQQCEMVSLAALEFWNTICDVEIILSVDEEKDESQEQVLYHFIRQAKPILLPILFEAMTTQGLSVGFTTLTITFSQCLTNVVLL